MMKLYYFPPSPNSRRAQAVALHLDLSIDYHLINLQAGDQRQVDFLAVNPTGRIPVLQDGDFILWESNAIMQYLADQQPNSLWPHDVRQRADIVRWQSWQLAHWSQACQPLNYERFVKQILQLGGPDSQVLEAATQRFHREATVLDHHLATTDYLVNNELTLADFSVASDLTYASVAEFPLEGYPQIRAWFDRIATLPAWQKTAPQE